MLLLDCVSDDDRTNLLKTVELLGKFSGAFTHKVDLTIKEEQRLFGPLKDE